MNRITGGLLAMISAPLAEKSRAASRCARWNAASRAIGSR
jgi:hypothetical protein